MNATPHALQILRQHPDLLLRSIPETIHIPALGGEGRDISERPTLDASIDEIAFTLLQLDDEIRAKQEVCFALHRLYEQARKRGARGNTTVAEAFSDLLTESTAP
jgi:hypothetical protein